MDNFLEGLRDDGATDSVSASFTLDPASARRKLLASVPPGDFQIQRGMMFIEEALAGLGLEKSLTHTHLLRLVPSEGGYWNLSFKGPQVLQAGLSPGQLKEFFNSPFQSNDAFALDWTRGLLRLLVAGCEVELWQRSQEGGWHLHFQGNEAIEKPYKTSRIPILDLWVTKLRCARTPQEIWRFETERKKAVETLQLGASDPLETRWDGPTQAGWFDYRVRPLVLWETVVEVGCPGGLRFTRKHEGRDDLDEYGVERPNLNRTWWDKLNNVVRVPVLLRQFPLEGELPKEGRCRAIFNVRLSEDPAEVHLSNGGHSPHPFPLPGAPAGLQAVVYWPELTRDMWGESWVRDQELERALAWCQERAQEVAASLHSYKWQLESMVLENFCKRVYRDEVQSKLRALWFNPPAAPPAASEAQREQPAALPNTPEARAAAIRTKLGFHRSSGVS